MAAFNIPPGNLPLGQGFYVPLDPAEQMHQTDLFRFVAIAACGALIWEHIVTFHEEVERWKQLLSGRPTLVGSLVLVSRYSIWVSAIATFCFFFPPNSNIACEATITVIFVFIAISYICLANVFILRVRSLWAGSGPSWFTPALYSLMVVVSACWIASVPGFHGMRVPELFQVKYGPVCMPAPAPYWRILGWAMAAVFDVIIYTLTLVKVQQLRRSPMADQASVRRLRSFVFNSSTLYFLVSFACNVSCVLVLSLYRNMILQNIPILLSGIMNSIIACRVVFHSDLFSDGKTGLLVINPLRRSMSTQRQRIVGHVATTPHMPELKLEPQQNATPVVMYAGGVEVDETGYPFDRADNKLGLSSPMGESVREGNEMFEMYNSARASHPRSYTVSSVGSHRQQDDATPHTALQMLDNVHNVTASGGSTASHDRPHPYRNNSLTRVNSPAKQLTQIRTSPGSEQSHFSNNYPPPSRSRQARSPSSASQRQSRASDGGRDGASPIATGSGSAEAAAGGARKQNVHLIPMNNRSDNGHRSSGSSSGAPSSLQQR